MTDETRIRSRLRTFTIVASLALAIALSGAAWAFRASHDAAVRERATLCQAQNQTKSAVRQILELARASSRHAETPEARAFYATAFRLTRPTSC